MGKIKYIFSVIALAGMTLSFYIFLDYYQQSAFAGQQKEDIRELELMPVKRSYTSEEITQMLLNEQYHFLDEIENSMSDEQMIQACTKNIQKMLESEEYGDLHKYIEAGLIGTQVFEIVTNRYVGYIGDEPIIFNMVSIWTEQVNVTYEEQTGVISVLEYNIFVDESDVDWESIKMADGMLRDAVKEYYAELGLKEKEVADVIYDANRDSWVICIRLQRSEQDIEVEKE